MERRVLDQTLFGLAALFAVACGHSIPAPVPTSPIVSPPAIDEPAPPPVTELRAVGLLVRDQDGDRVAGASCSLQDKSGEHVETSNDRDGYLAFQGVTAGLRATHLTCTADGFEPFSEHRDLQTGGNEDLAPAVLRALHVDPSGIPLEELAAIRGAMWPQGPLGSTPASATLEDGSRCAPDDIPFGPRPGQPDNIFATDFLANYSPHQQLCIVAELKARGYTHAVIGPLIDSDGYHGQYTPRDWTQNFDGFLDVAQFLYDHQLIPVVFIKPDGMLFDEARDRFTALLSTPRARRLLRIVVVTGWEPWRYEVSSCTWANFVRWGRDVFGPNALILIHTVADVDAPVGTDALCDDNGRPNGEGWTRVVGAGLDGWLIQNGAYSVAPHENPELARNFAAQFMADGDGAELHGARWHFAHGVAGWPSFTWRGKPLLLYAAEHTSFTAYWQHMAEATRLLWGNLAIDGGADGYLDGGTVPVPIRR